MATNESSTNLSFGTGTDDPSTAAAYHYGHDAFAQLLAYRLHQDYHTFFLAGEWPLEQHEDTAKAQATTLKAKKDAKKNAIQSKFWIIKDVDDKKGITLTDECLGVKAATYPRQQTLIDPDRTAPRAHLARYDLSPRNRKMLQDYMASKLNNFGKDKRSPTHARETRSLSGLQPLCHLSHNPVT
ncbi:hypothetical protein SLS54_000083 [Diplodia seriata]